MAYLIVPDIKDERVVCQKTCQHKDCAAIRAEWSNATCALCGKPMLNGQKFYYNKTKQPGHAACVGDMILKRLRLE